MKNRFILLILLLSAGTLDIASVSLAAPSRTKKTNYEVVTGLVDVPNGSYVEGSFRKGGIQPDYHIDYGHPEIERLVKYARIVEMQEPDVWKRIYRLENYILKKHMPNVDYDDPEYLKTNRKYLGTKRDVPLGAYSVCQAGVCREHGLYLNIALREAGIENYHAYAQIKRMSQWGKFDLVEDHAFVVAKIENELWVLDSYYSRFNGFKLKDLMSETGVSSTSELAPVIGKSEAGFRRILRINQFPKIYVPKGKEPPRVLKVGDYFEVPSYKKCSNYLKDFFAP